MGIDNFHKWIKETYPDCFKKISGNNRYDNMYIDMNHILHACIHRCFDKKEFKKKLYQNLDNILSSFVVTKNIVLGTDGPAPYSKLILQRKRRLQGAKGINVVSLNPIYLTPGTKFMRYVDNIINEYIKGIKKMLKFNKVNIVSFGSSIPDEGELKLFKYISEYKDSVKQSHIIIGNDADLIVMSTANKSLINANILIKDNYSFELLSIKDLMIAFHKNTVKSNIEDDNLFLSNNRDDFSCLSLMMGNDYLPKLQNIKFETLFKSYENMRYINKDGLIVKGNFNKDFLMGLMADLINNMAKQFKKFNISRYDKQTVRSYLKGLLWCLDMYQTGTCPQYDYMYEGLYKPSPHDIMHYVITNKKLNIQVPNSDSKPILARYYGMYVLPKAGLSLIPKDVKAIAENNLSDIYDIEECTECKKISKSISKKHKKMNEINKREDKEMYDDERKALSNVLRDLNEKFINHKKIVHKNREFGIDDIKKLSTLS